MNEVGFCVVFFAHFFFFLSYCYSIFSPLFQSFVAFNSLSRLFFSFSSSNHQSIIFPLIPSRFAVDQTVGLRHAGLVISVEKLVKDSNDEVVEIIASCASSTEAPKPKAFIQWVRKSICIFFPLFFLLYFLFFSSLFFFLFPSLLPYFSFYPFLFFPLSLVLLFIHSSSV